MTQPIEDSYYQNQENSQSSDKTDSFENKQNEQILSRNRSTRTKSSISSSGKCIPIKGKSRRTIIKKQPIKLQSFTSTLESVDYIFYKGIYYQLEDIVSTTDDNGDIYFARITKLIQNEFFDKFALLTWLLPTSNCDLDSPYKSENFIDGLQDSNAHRLEFLKLVSNSKKIRNKFSMPHDGNGLISVRE